MKNDLFLDRRVIVQRDGQGDGVQGWRRRKLHVFVHLRLQRHGDLVQELWLSASALH